MDDKRLLSQLQQHMPEPELPPSLEAEAIVRRLSAGPRAALKRPFFHGFSQRNMAVAAAALLLVLMASAPSWPLWRVGAGRALPDNAQIEMAADSAAMPETAPEDNGGAGLTSSYKSNRSEAGGLGGGSGGEVTFGLTYAGQRAVIADDVLYVAGDSVATANLDSGRIKFTYTRASGLSPLSIEARDKGLVVVLYAASEGDAALTALRTAKWSNNYALPEAVETAVEITYQSEASGKLTELERRELPMPAPLALSGGRAAGEGRTLRIDLSYDVAAGRYRGMLCMVTGSGTEERFQTISFGDSYLLSPAESDGQSLWISDAGDRAGLPLSVMTASGESAAQYNFYSYSAAGGFQLLAELPLPGRTVSALDLCRAVQRGENLYICFDGAVYAVNLSDYSLKYTVSY